MERRGEVGGREVGGKFEIVFAIIIHVGILPRWKFAGGNFLGSNFPDGDYPRWGLFRWEFSRWELSG